VPIENRNLEAGTVLTARYKKEDRTCEVVQTDEGLRYRLDDGTEHKSPSSAGKAAMGGVSCNGWRFWSLKGTEPAKKPTAKKEPKAKEPKAEKPAKAEKEPAAKTKAAPKKSAKAKSAKKPKAQRAAAKGDSYGCGVCPATFPTQKKAVAHAMTHTS
jgi:type IV secretory pathway VirB10-like protein